MHLLSPQTRIDSLRPILAAAAAGETVTISPDDVTMRDMLFFGETGSRTEIALLVWRAVAEFIHDHEPLTQAPGLTLAETAEAYVKEHADEAMGCTLDYPGRLIYPVLHNHSLHDDFDRMRLGCQADAFGPDEQ